MLDTWDHWDHVWSTLLAPEVNTHLSLTQGFCFQSQVTIVDFDATFFSNEMSIRSSSWMSIMFALLAIVQLHLFV